MEVLKLEKVSKFYTSKTSVVMGLSNVNLSFSVGEFVAITGESGSGKSTLAHILGGIIPYESGELYINGSPTSHYDASDWERYRRDLISFISQSYGVLVGNTVLENVEAALRFGGLDKDETRKRALEILKEVDLLHIKSRKAGKLSSGQKQRLSIARALAKPSRILIADEPTGNLDAENSEKIIELLHKASKDRLVIIITHEFSEVENYATRRIILSDASVVTDAPINQGEEKESSADATEVRKTKSVGVKKTSKDKKYLAPYVTKLTVKSRPVFSAIICVFLAITSLITFVFLGTFTVSLDDSNTKIYDSSAFLNGNSSRLIVLKNDGTAFTESDFNNMLDVSYVKDVEEWGSIYDTNYYYREDLDYRTQKVIEEGKNNSNYGSSEFFVVDVVTFLYEGLYMSTVPKVGKDIIEDGRAPVGMYEVLSADPEHKVGDKVTVHIRNRNNWVQGSYISLNLTVVGKTDYGHGLYFSDEMANFIDTSCFFTDPGDVLFIPYKEGVFEIAQSKSEITEFNETDVFFPGNEADNPRDIGNQKYFNQFEQGTISLKYTAIFKCDNKKVYVVHENVYDAYMPQKYSNQATVHIKDYSYTDRVIADLTEKGYTVFSPFRIGAVTEDEELSSERTVTLAICLAAFALTTVLQLILLKAMFNSISVHYKLMSNIGLTSHVAYWSIGLMFLIYTFISEIIGFGIVLILNAIGLKYVVDIFKYLDVGTIIILILVHFAICTVSFLSVRKSVRKQVFATEKADEDLDFTQMEEVEAND
ncbi:MAG: ABC transporter ATP-binding protein [Clostridia bacterium]|nr:ABC transporter ATP-binding protein [Clostridia bacterium]